jgi:exonuclease VII small subunit
MAAIVRDVQQQCQARLDQAHQQVLGLKAQLQDEARANGTWKRKFHMLLRLVK